MVMPEITIAKTDEEILKCYPVMLQLRPAYSAEDFLAQVKKQMQTNYLLAYLMDNTQVCAVAGYRYSEGLAWGKFLYVDDLVTDSQQRSKGYGKSLLGWLFDQARQNQCNQLHLDSGVQRLDAHRFYIREGMSHSSQHFHREIQ